MKIQCSNCLEDITLSFSRSTVSYTFKAEGRGSLRTAARTVTNPLFTEGDNFFTFESPCCEDYWDSLET